MGSGELQLGPLQGFTKKRDVLGFERFAFPLVGILFEQLDSVAVEVSSDFKSAVTASGYRHMGSEEGYGSRS